MLVTNTPRSRQALEYAYVIYLVLVVDLIVVLLV